MISHKDIPEMLRKCRIENFVIKNLDGYKMFEHRGNSPQASVVEWNSIVKYLSHHKQLLVEAGNKDTGKGKGMSKFCWEIFIDGDNRNNQPQNNYYGAMAGPDMNHPLLQMKLKELELENKIKELENKRGGGDSDDKWINLLGQVLPEMMGKGKGNTLNGPDNLRIDEKDEMIKKLELLMERVCKKVSVKKIIKLLEAVEKNPKLADKALNFLG